jgi:predicted DNA-binding transcriptional regulator AlpA
MKEYDFMRNQPCVDDGPANAASSNPTNDPMELLPKSDVCRLFGNINPSTLYRGIRQGRYPRPVRIGPNSSRWLLTECRDALRLMVEARYERH